MGAAVDSNHASDVAVSVPVKAQGLADSHRACNGSTPHADEVGTVDALKLSVMTTMTPSISKKPYGQSRQAVLLAGQHDGGISAALS